jgi:hypothetical protein
MEIHMGLEAIGAGRPEPPRHQPVQTVRTAQVAPDPADGENARAVPVAPEPRLRTDVVRHPGGVQQVTISDVATGQAVAQTPPDTVLNVIDAAIWQLRQRRES